MVDKPTRCDGYESNYLVKETSQTHQVIAALKECKRNRAMKMTKEEAEDRCIAYLNCVFRDDL